MRRNSFVLSVAVIASMALSLFGAVEARALPVSASETIDDIQAYDLFSRNLQRTRTDSTGTVVENNDATIVAENLVDGDFGIWNNSDVSYQHSLAWINPAAGSYLTMSLQIEAYGVDGGNDKVFLDTYNFGTLVNDGSLLENFSTTIFSESNPVTLNLLLADGVLNVLVDKNNGANIVGRLDQLSVYKSTLSVRYEPVPEPASMVLLGSSLVGLAARRRRAKAAA